jgi:isopenicillin-N epimerase
VGGQTLRDQFLLDPDLVFLNHGSYGACPREVFERYQRWQLELERNPVQFLGRRSAALLREARERLAAFVGARADDLVLTPNATTGVNIVARSLPLEPGDEIVTTDLEYGACVATFARQCKARGARLRIVPIPLPLNSERFAARMLDALGPRTRLVFVSHITSGTALCLPIEGLVARARERGVLTLIDGAHAPGQIDLNLDALGADFYAGNGHKWLCAPKGVAFLHARSEHHALLHAPVTSWGELADRDDAQALHGFTGSSLLERRLQWQGTRDIAAFLTLPAAIDWLERQGWQAQRERCRSMALALLHRHHARWGGEPIAPDHGFAQMVPLAVPQRDAEALRAQLFDRFRIEAPVTQHLGQSYVRASVGAYTTEQDLAALERALQDLAARTG